MIKFVAGDIFAGNHRALGHGCNCQGIWGAGIAKQMKEHFPNVFLRHQEYVNSRKTVYPYARDLLGFLNIEEENGITIYNLFTQLRPGPYVSLDTISSSVQSMIHHAELYNIGEIALPRIGAGLGGGQWSSIKQILLQVCVPSPIQIIVYEVYVPDIKQPPLPL